MFILCCSHVQHSAPYKQLIPRIVFHSFKSHRSSQRACTTYDFRNVYV